MFALVVDSHTGLVETLSHLLEPHGLIAQGASSCEEADQFLRQHRVGVVLLGAMLPDRSGVQYLKLLRSYPATRDLPLIMLGPRSSDIDIAIGLEAGADDYVAGRMSPIELQRRILAVMRRCEVVSALPDSTTEMRCGPLVFDQATRRARVHGDVLVLRRVEADLLAHLLSAPGRVFTRSQLVKLVCDSDNVLERVIDVHVSRLRMSLANVGAESMIETVRGIGYRLLDLPMTDSRSV